jgi:5-hydroxyisourate hydrolase-like protein (transthyretin family)
MTKHDWTRYNFEHMCKLHNDKMKSGVYKLQFYVVVFCKTESNTAANASGLPPTRVRLGLNP